MRLHKIFHRGLPSSNGRSFHVSEAKCISLRRFLRLECISGGTEDAEFIVERESDAYAQRAGRCQSGFAAYVAKQAGRPFGAVFTVKQFPGGGLPGWWESSRREGNYGQG